MRLINSLIYTPRHSSVNPLRSYVLIAHLSLLGAIVSSGLICGCTEDPEPPPAAESMTGSDDGLLDELSDMNRSIDAGDQIQDMGPNEPDQSLDAAIELDLDTTPILDAELDIPRDTELDDPRLEPEFVMNEVKLLPSTEGFDLDADGTPNNGLAFLFEDPIVGAALGGDPNEYIARTVRRGELLVLLSFRGLSDFRDDPHFDLDIFLGRDTDDRRRNNFNGSEEFSVTCSSLNAEGEPDNQFFDATLSEGQLNGERGRFRFLITFSNTEVLLREARFKGTMSEDGESISAGMIGGSVIFSELEEVVRNDPEIGSGFAEIMLNFIRAKLDIDRDGDGVKDALSASFEFSAVRAVVDRELPCATE